MTTDVLPLESATYPVPAGRGRWRLSAHRRDFSGQTWQQTMVNYTRARARKLERLWDAPAKLTFTVDGAAPDAQWLTELTTDVMAWRWDDTTGTDVAVFRGVITAAVDTLDEQSHVVTFTVADYLAMLARRLVWASTTYTAVDQDTIANNLVNLATAPQSSSGTSFAPGGYLPIATATVNPDGTTRATPSSQTRTLTYTGSYIIGTALDELAKLASGFDYDVAPASSVSLGTGNADALRIFYPHQGIQRTDLVYVYGVNVAAVTRSVDSTQYGNYWRVLGNNGSADPAAAQVYGEAWNTDSNNVTVNPVGLWASADNAPSQTLTAALVAQAGGDLALKGTLTPTYTVRLRPGVYVWGSPRMGDTVQLIVNSGRLAVNTWVKVVGITYTIGDDGDEDVALTVGLPDYTLSEMFADTERDVNALVRR